jgi:hypothetical protein
VTGLFSAALLAGGCSAHPVTAASQSPGPSTVGTDSPAQAQAQEQTVTDPSVTPGASKVGSAAMSHPQSGNAPKVASGPADVGSNPTVQQWFAAHGAQRLAVNDALGRAYLQLDKAAGGANGCTDLRSAAVAMLATLPTPKRTLDPFAVAGITQFKTGAEQCLAGDTAAARASLAAGAQARGDAENELDEILEAPNASVK